MVHDSSCAYCVQADKLLQSVAPVTELAASKVYLWRDGTYRGRCIVALKEHKTELCDLDEAQRNQFMSDVSRVVAAIRAGFGADKINYGIFGDTVPHFHFHLVPKKKNGPDWGKPFVPNPVEFKSMTDAEILECIEIIKSNLK